MSCDTYGKTEGWSCRALPHVSPLVPLPSPSAPLTISFDLDSTLIPCGYEFEVGPWGLRARWLRAEPIRRGTVALFEVLRKRGYGIWIYTTSHRSPRSIRRTLLGYGLRVSGVVMEGERDGFAVVRVAPGDAGWMGVVLTGCHQVASAP